MTQAKAATVAAALIGQGFKVSVGQDTSAGWYVRAEGQAIDVQAVAAFATNQNVNGFIMSADFK